MRAFFPVLLLVPLWISAQGLVSHEPMNRTVLLEEYAAIKCGNCPAAHVIVGAILDAHPNDAVGVEVHGGSLAVPSSGQPDFRTPDGTALWNQFNVNFQPQGMVNRQGLISPSNYTSASNAVLAQSSPVNVGMATDFESGSRMLTVDVELYYTADGEGGNDRISVLLTEDHIIGYQQDYVNGAQANYDHRHVLRTYITPLVGDEVSTTAAGTTILRTYMFEVPEEWNIAQCASVAFIGEQSIGSTPGVIYQVSSVPASGGTTVGIDAVSADPLGEAYPVPATEMVTIPVTVSVRTTLEVRDATGRMVRQERIVPGQRAVVLKVSDLNDGLYFYGVRDGAVKRLVVVH